MTDWSTMVDRCIAFLERELVDYPNDRGLQMNLAAYRKWRSQLDADAKAIMRSQERIRANEDR